MSPPDALKGLTCPRCGGMVAVPEGQAIVICPFCELRSVVRGTNGVRRYQVPIRTNQTQAEQSFRKFLISNMAIAPTARGEAKLTESFIVHLPFWATWGRALGWVFGKKQVGSGDNKRWEAREIKVVQEMAWNSAACEVGEFGVTQVSLEGRPLEPFAADLLHRSGMVFEPTGSAFAAQELARQHFESAVSRKADIDRVSQTFVRIVRPRRGLVYYPLWVMRYDFRGRIFQVVIDGSSGEVLYGKAPGNVLYRAAVLVGGMAAGAFILVDLPWLILNSSSNSNSPAGFAIAMLAAGLAAMYFSYRTYRYGEHYEYRKRYAELDNNAWSSVVPDSVRQVSNILKKLE